MAPIFAELRKALGGGDVFTPEDTGYEESLLSWSATCVKPAAAVVRPVSADDVSSVIRFASAHKISVVVRGGGHSPSGASATDGGILIDLGRMRSVSVDVPNLTVTFGGGCIWEDVDNALWEHGLATVGGTVSHTGVGGLILGGGYGVLSGLHGLAIDVLLECEVVLSDGSVVTASATSYPDLFWALRGAGHSFGVVTQFKSRAFPQGDVWGGLIAWPRSQIPKVIQFVNNEFIPKTQSEAHGGGNKYMMPTLLCHPKTGEGMIGVALFYNGAKTDAEELYGPLLRLDGQVMNTTAEIPYPKANTFPNSKVPHGKRYMFSGADFVSPLDTLTVQTAADLFFGMMEKTGNEEMKPRSMVGFEITPYDKIQEIATHETAFASRDRKGYNIIVNISWDNEDKDLEAKELCSKVSGLLKRTCGWKGDGAGDRGGTYFNYLNPAVDGDRAFTAVDRVFGPNAARLRDLKFEFDPTNVFDKTVNLMPTGSGKVI